jgi:NAD(P)-dependent dehydrogenase (short-subunit alcohol dehydrogenase family)
MTNVNTLLDFSGRVVIVTGASRGIGLGIATRFAEAGASVVINYLHEAGQAQDFLPGLRAQGAKVIGVAADVTLRDDVQRLVMDSLEAFGRIDVLVNNAGSYPLHPLLEMSDDAWRDVLARNLGSVHLCTQVVGGHMVEAGQGGAIVNIASIEALHPVEQHAHYDAAKAGVLAHTRVAARELGVHGIRVNAVSPGLIYRDGIDQEWPEGVRRYSAAAPLGRLGRPQDIADACLFLASPAASWVTGTNLVVDGGVTTGNVY